MLYWTVSVKSVFVLSNKLQFSLPRLSSSALVKCSPVNASKASDSKSPCMTLPYWSPNYHIKIKSNFLFYSIESLVKGIRSRTVVNGSLSDALSA